MTSATTEPASTTDRRRAEGHGLIIDVIALYGLCAYGSRVHLTA